MDNIKEIANVFLSEMMILQILAEHGTPQLHGSYDLDLMMWPEIDINLGVDTVNMKAACSIAKSLSDKIIIHDLHMINQVDYEPRFAIENMIILDVSTEYSQHEWKLDIGIISKEMLVWSRKYNDNLRPNITKKIADTIKTIKGRCLLSKRYRRRNWDYIKREGYFYSNDIYQSVISGKANTYKDFVEYMKRSRGLDINDT